DVMESDWPFNVSFVVFMAQAVNYLGDDTSGLGQMVQPGGVLTDRLPLDAQDVSVRTPTGGSAPMGAPAPDGTVVYGPVQTTGVYKVSWAGKPGPTDADLGGGRSARPFASNLLDPEESDVAAAQKLDLASKTVAAEKDSQTKVTRSLWPWFILGALVVILLEW